MVILLVEDVVSHSPQPLRDLRFRKPSAPSTRQFPGDTGRFTISKVSAQSGHLVSFSSDKVIRRFELDTDARFDELPHRLSPTSTVHRCQHPLDT